MRVRLAVSSFAILIAVVAAAPIPRAQSSVPPTAPGKKNPLLKLAEPWPDAAALKARRLEAEKRPLFKTTDPLEFTLTANFNAINKDHNPESTTRYPAVLTVAGADGAPKNIAVKLSARGHFRRMARNCAVVPLRVEFPKEGTAGTPFDGQTTLKLGTGCEDSKEYEQITLREYLTYPMFNMVTPLSFRARLARATYIDEKSKKKSTAALRAVHRARKRRRAPQRRAHRRAAAAGVQGPRRPDADADDAVRVHDRQHRHVDLGAAQHPPDPEAEPHADRRAVRLRPLGLRARAVRDPRPPARPAQRRRSRVSRAVPDDRRVRQAAAAPFRAKRADMLSLVDSMRDLESRARNEVKDYLEGFFRTIDKPESIKKTFVDGCKTEPTM